MDCSVETINRNLDLETKEKIPFEGEFYKEGDKKFSRLKIID